MMTADQRGARGHGWLVLAAALVSAGCVEGRAEWLATGPFGGAAEIVRTIPKQPNAVLAGTANGLLYQSLDGGATWVHRPFPAQLNGTLHAIEADPRHAGTWYAGVESDNPDVAGVYKTEDGGATWNLLPGLKGQGVWALALWTAGPDIIAAGTSDGVFLSRDAGASWVRISPASNRELRPVVSLAFDPTNRDILYAGTTHLPWRTRDGGAHWESIHTGMIDDSDVFSIAVEARSPATVFASACSGVYRSDDGGSTWRRMATPHGAFRSYLVTLDPRHSGVVFGATSAGLLRSANGGLTWNRVSPFAVKSIAFDPVDPDKIYCASVTGGLLISRDGGNIFRESNNGFSNRNFAAMAGSGDVLYTSSVYEPASGGVFRSDDHGLRWRRMTSPGGGENVVLLAAAPDDPDRVYAAGYRSLFRSTDGARTWVRQTTPKSGERITALLPLSRGSLLVGTAGGLFRVTGGSWAAVKSAGARLRVELLESPGGGSIAAVTSAGAYRSDNGGTSWVACGQPTKAAVWYALALDSGQTGRALAATAQGLFRSTDGCASWRAVENGLDQATVSFAMFDSGRAGEALAAQFGRIFRTTDGGLSWSPLDDRGRDGSYPSALLVLPAAPRRLFALFPRRGILSIVIDSSQDVVSRGGN
jgi:photosystem II stability/assembly factor-like uncharacterized protein